MLMMSLMAWKSREVMARSTSGTTRRVSRPLDPLDRWRSAIVKGAHTCLHTVHGAECRLCQLLHSSVHLRCNGHQMQVSDVHSQ